jgi:uncharacterized protein
MSKFHSTISSTWTDHNPHDPGITLLEHLAYAISDLSYRLGFSVEDLLAEVEAGGERPFFSAREILPQAPLTLLDYRKLLLDCSVMEAGQDKRLVKNAWLTPLRAPEASAIRYDARFGEWRFGGQGEEVSFKGDYRVLIEPFHPSLSEVEKAAIIGILHSHRNLGEDFPLAEIHFLEDPEYITLVMEIELEDTADPTVLYDILRSQLAGVISPTLRFYTLAEMTVRGKTAEDIFKGPRLTHGFIDDDELRRFDKKTSLRGSDLLHLVMDAPGVKTVRSILMSSSLHPGQQEKQYLKLAADRAPRLAQFTPRFFKGRRPVSFAIPGENVEIAPPFPAGRAEDLHVPTGKYRIPGRFFSLTHDLPHIYGVGPGGLPAGAGVQREAQALQLKAYIALFEQILANYLGQTAHFKDLFNVHYRGDQTYFPQFPGGADGIPGFEALRRHVIDLYRLTEPDGAADERINRLLDHLLARFVEQAPEVPPEAATRLTESDHIQKKQHFLRQYAALSYKRNCGLDYTQPPSPWNNSDNCSGFEKRLRLLLNLPPAKEIKLTNTVIEIYDETDKVPDGRTEYRFRVRDKVSDKILLSSSTRYADEASANFELQWALRQAAFDDGYQKLHTTDGRHYFNIVAPGGEVIARRIEYFKEPADQIRAIAQLQELVKPAVTDGEPCYLIERQLIRPQPTGKEQMPKVFPEVFLPVPNTILSFEVETIYDPFEIQILWCHSTRVDRKKGQKVKIFQSVDYDGIYTVYGSRVTSEGKIQKKWLGVYVNTPLTNNLPATNINAQWIPIYAANESLDLWSLQFSFIFRGEFLLPGAIDSRKELYEDIVHSESLAHLSPEIIWMNPFGFSDFERLYFNWRYKTAHGADTSQEIKEMNQMLGIAQAVQVFHGLKLTGSGSHLEFPKDCLVQGSKKNSFFFWMKVNTLDERENIILQITNDPSAQLNQWVASISSRKIQFVCIEGQSKVESISWSLDPADFIGKWVHLGLVKDVERASMQIYFNGELVANAIDKTIALPDKIESFKIGNLTTSIFPKFSGVFADLQLWQTADWPSSIKDIIPFRLAGNEPGLQGYWKLDEGEGNVAHDSTEKKNHAEIYHPNWI